MDIVIFNLILKKVASNDASMEGLCKGSTFTLILRYPNKESLDVCPNLNFVALHYSSTLF